MFYFNEIWKRFFFSFVYYALLILLCFFYKHLFFYFFSLPLLKTTNHLIYTNPIEFIMSYFLMIVFVSLYFYLFYVFWQILDFLKSGLYFNEYKFYFKFFSINIVLLLIFNFLVVSIFLPLMWDSFEYFNIYLNKFNTLNLFLELKILDYINFLQYNLVVFNSILLLFLIFSFFNLHFFIQFKKLYCLFNLFFSTIVSTTDLYSQFYFLFLLQLFFEVYIIFNILKYKFNKTLKIFNRNY